MYVLESSKLQEVPSKLFDEMISYGLLQRNKDNELMLNPIFFTHRDINTVTYSEKSGVKAQNTSQCDSICDEVIHFLNQEAKTRYKPNVQATRRLINARVKEGFTLDDFKTVIHAKCKEWGGDPKMKKYIRPSTLFAPTKFEGYLNQAEPYKEGPKREERREQEEPILYDVDMNW